MKRIIFSIICVFIISNTSILFAGPSTNLSDVAEIKIYDENSNLLFDSKDEKIIERIATAIKSGVWYGNNTYNLNLTQEIHFFSSDAKASKWYVDLKLGYYARLTPPKLAIYRFKNDDFSYIKKAIKNTEHQDTVADHQRGAALAD